jgi:hypothetical protein
MCTLELPKDDRLHMSTSAIESAMGGESRKPIQSACSQFMIVAAEFYGVPQPAVRALAARPLRVREGGWATELFGDYSPGTSRVRFGPEQP